MRKYVTIILLLSLALVVPSGATRYESGDGTKVLDLKITSGSTPEMGTGNVKLQDLKGYPFGQPMVSDGITLWPGMGALVGGEILPQLTPGMGGIVITCLNEDGTRIKGGSFTLSLTPMPAGIDPNPTSTDFGSVIIPNIAPGSYDIEITYNMTANMQAKCIIQQVWVVADQWTKVSAIFVAYDGLPGTGGIAALLMQGTTKLANEPFSYAVTGPTATEEVQTSTQAGLIKIKNLEPGTYSVIFTRSDLTNGWANDLPVVEGQYTGVTIIFGEVPYGTVPLAITRNGSNIEVTWNNNMYPNPQIFILAEDGTGKYTNFYVPLLWEKFDAGTGPTPVLPVFGGTPAGIIAPGVLSHAGQVGGGAGEVYYKALLSSITPAEYATYIPLAPAVGKMNVGLKVSAMGDVLNLISYPFDVLKNPKLSEVIGDQLQSGDIFEMYVPNAGYVTSDMAPTWTTDYLFKENGLGFWLLMKRRAQTGTYNITLVGNVLNSKHQMTLVDGLNCVGNPFPAMKELGEIGISSFWSTSKNDIVEQYVNADPDPRKHGYTTSDYQDGNWTNINIKFYPGMGLWYLNNSGNTENWELMP